MEENLKITDKRPGLPGNSKVNANSPSHENPLIRRFALLLFLLNINSNALQAAGPYARYVAAGNGGIYAVGDDAALSYFRHQPENGFPSWSQEAFTQVEFTNGWGFDHILYSGNGVLYAANLKGELIYYRDTIAGIDHTFVNSPTKVSLGNGWAAYRWLLGDGGGRIYAIDEGGEFYFYQHSEQPDLNWPVPSAMHLGSGWQIYKWVIAGRDGIIYAVNHAGQMFYYRDLARDGTVNWQFGGLPLLIGDGWNRFQHLTSTGNGNLYGIDPAGNVYYYHISVNNAGVADYTGSNPATHINPGAPVEPHLYKGVYCWPLSGAPGDGIDFKISLGGPTQITFSRLYGAPAGNGPRRIFKHEEVITTTIQPVLDVPARLGCGWETTYHLTDPADWESGTYLCQCYPVGGSDDPVDGQAFEATFIVKPDPARRSKIACLANTNTWNAYNPVWGGSHYTHNRSNLSFLRPLTDNVTQNSGLSLGLYHLGSGEMWVQSWFEYESIRPSTGIIPGIGVRPDVYTDLDFHNGVDISSYCAIFISTHPEYWSVEMYVHLSDYLRDGGILIYLGGNGIYERVAYSADQTRMVLNGGVDVPEEGVNGVHYPPYLFRTATAPTRNERDLLGVATAACGIGGGGYTIMRPSHPLLRNVISDGLGMIGAGNNGLFQVNPRAEGMNGKAAGYETDNAAGADMIPSGCSSGPIGGLATAAPLQARRVVLGRALAINGGGDSEMIYYPHPGGGFVFSVGSITFGGMLAVDPQLQTLMRNVLREACTPSPSILSFTASSPGKYLIKFHGHPGGLFRVEGTSVLSDFWDALQDYNLSTDSDEATFSRVSALPRYFFRMRPIRF